MEMMRTGTQSGGPSGSTVNNQAEWSLESFLQHRPAKFNGKCSADEGDHWLRDMEKIYNTKRCPNDNMLTYTEYQLIGEASHWWSALRMMLEDERVPITWDLFKEKFYGEYFPDNVRFAKEVEFLQLVQGGMTATEYTDRFKHLVRFYTMGINEEWQCRKSENGLKPDLKVMISNLCIKSFPVLVE
ncbi:uncharacterized protein LOC106779479 [Vigna radiata var. radiata]|uniref:Uncharacterized protein LOC106779479 n=1 Tax=Vigna radiata var. radiata TaxID=3916 RepID=A0A1S3VXH9_VIGRR|nr:uncharacterized protein LOC106779479 [Vigna radiata var. radiata]